jgi:hypothetical protein
MRHVSNGIVVAFETDVLACPRCLGRMVLLATIEI